MILFAFLLCTFVAIVTFAVHVREENRMLEDRARFEHMDRLMEADNIHECMICNGSGRVYWYGMGDLPFELPEESECWRCYGTGLQVGERKPLQILITSASPENGPAHSI